MAEAPVLELECEADGIDFILKTGKQKKKDVKGGNETIKENLEVAATEPKEDMVENNENGENQDNGVEKPEEGGTKDEDTSKPPEKPKVEEISENFKVELGGLPKYYPLSQLKKLLNTTLQLDAHRVKAGGLGRNVAYANFRDEDSRFKAMTIINGYKWQGSSLTAEKADPTKDPTLLTKIDYLKMPKKEFEQLPLNDRVQKATIPLFDKEYEAQIKEKDKVIKQVLRKFGNELSQLNPELKKFVHWHKIRRKGQICELEDFIQSPVKEGYCNKCDFYIGKNKESENPVVGYRVANYKDATIEVGPIEHLVHINGKMKKAAKLLEQYLSTSKYETFDPFTNLGVWRQLTIRTTQNDDVMMIIVIDPQQMEESEINDIKEDVTSFFTVGDGTEGGVTSIYFQQLSQAMKESGKEADYEHVNGKTFIEETILGKTFKASPDAFLQVNTAACEVLYQKIAEMADIDQTSVVLDVCSGVGTIGMCVADCAYKMLGVELKPSAVDDARANAETNGIANAIFYNGKAEDYIDSMIEKSQRANTIAVVDPPHTGLSGSVMNALRKCEYLDKMVYVSSDPQGALGNFQALSRPRSNSYKGTYFVPVRAIPVDMFPHTPNFVLAILFERYDECKWDRIMDGNPRPKDQAYYDRVPELKYDAEKDMQEREQKRKEKRGAKRKEQRARPGGGGGGGGGERVRDRGRNNWQRDWGGNYGNYGGGGGGRRERERGDMGGRNFRQSFGSGFQEGFQAGLQALANQYPGFGQGGGWNMAQTREGGFGGTRGNNMSNNSPMKGRTQGGTWDYEGFDGPSSSGEATAYNSNNGQDYSNQLQTTYPLTTISTVRSNQGTGYQSGGWNRRGNNRRGGGNQMSGGSFNRNSGNQMGSWSQNQYQSFEEPIAKKWKGGGMNQNTGFDFSNYNY